MTRRWGKLSRGVLCAAGRGERTGLREGRSVRGQARRKMKIPGEGGGGSVSLGPKEGENLGRRLW